MSATLNGTYFVLSTTGDSGNIMMSTSAKYSTSTSEVEISDASSGRYYDFLPEKITAKISVSGLIEINPNTGTQGGSLSLWNAAHNRTLISWRLYMNKERTIYFEGSGYITAFEAEGETESISTFSATLKVTGEPSYVSS